MLFYALLGARRRAAEFSLILYYCIAVFFFFYVYVYYYWGVYFWIKPVGALFVPSNLHLYADCCFFFKSVVKTVAIFTN